MRILTILFLTISLSACGSWEVLPGLCYNDKEGTTLCPPEIEKLPPQEPIECSTIPCSTEPMCEPISNIEETWEACIMVA
jgi:hypothetical protein